MHFPLFLVVILRSGLGTLGCIFTGPISFYGQVAAATESGLDYSTRWLDSGRSNFLTIRTQSIIPVYINAFICATEDVLCDLYQLKGWLFL